MALAIEAFRAERLDEPRELYLAFLTRTRVTYAGLLPQLRAVIGKTRDHAVLADMLGDAEKRRALLYIAAPPISEDDLKTIADAKLSRGSVLADPPGADRIIDVLARIFDPTRFPWLDADPERDPDAFELERAIEASAALVATQQVQTHRRNDAKDRQEEAVKDRLRTLQYVEVAKHEIRNLGQAPKPGTFMGETNVCGHRADVVVGLADGRLMCIECKVSNSAVNSFKRIVNDTGGKAPIWYRELGAANTVVAAVLTGVFKVDNLEFVQREKEVAIFWAHRLQDLDNFVGVFPRP